MSAINSAALVFAADGDGSFLDSPFVVTGESVSSRSMNGVMKLEIKESRHDIPSTKKTIRPQTGAKYFTAPQLISQELLYDSNSAHSTQHQCVTHTEAEAFSQIFAANMSTSHNPTQDDADPKSKLIPGTAEDRSEHMYQVSVDLSLAPTYSSACEMCTLHFISRAIQFLLSTQ